MSARQLCQFLPLLPVLFYMLQRSDGYLYIAVFPKLYFTSCRAIQNLREIYDGFELGFFFFQWPFFLSFLRDPFMFSRFSFMMVIPTVHFFFLDGIDAFDLVFT